MCAINRKYLGTVYGFLRRVQLTSVTYLASVYMCWLSTQVTSVIKQYNYVTIIVRTCICTQCLTIIIDPCSHYTGLNSE